MKRIPLTQGKFALVDDEDFEYLSQFKWHAIKPYRTWYARRSIPENRKKMLMHREILGLTRTEDFVDHKNGDGLNNQRYNIRLATPLQNSASFQRKRRGASSKFRGVTKRTYGWAVRVGPFKKRIELGHFKSEIEAARAYDTAAKQIYGEFASLNFPDKPATLKS